MCSLYRNVQNRNNHENKWGSKTLICGKIKYTVRIVIDDNQEIERVDQLIHLSIPIRNHGKNKEKRL